MHAKVTMQGSVAHWGGPLQDPAFTRGGTDVSEMSGARRTVSTCSCYVAGHRGRPAAELERARVVLPRCQVHGGRCQLVHIPLLAIGLA